MRLCVRINSQGEFTVQLDNEARIAIKITIDRHNRQAAIDFTGISSQLNNNFNAPSAVTQAAVLNEPRRKHF